MKNIQRKILTLSLLSFVSVQTFAFESAPKRTVILDNSKVSSHVASRAAPEGDSTVLSIDDGMAEGAIGDEGQFIWFNRFTPDPADFPFQLEEVHIVFGNTEMTAGDPIEIFIYQDTDGDGDPGTNAELLSNESKVVLDEPLFQAFHEYVLTNHVVFQGPGDILIGVVNRASSEGGPDFPAAQDQTGTAGRSWVGSYNAGDVPAVPTFPADEQWGIIDSFSPDLAGNWMIRGVGSANTPVELMNFSID